MSFYRQTLDNGLEIVAESNDAALSTALGFFVRTGSRDETDELSGVSHFLEHMAFKGPEGRTAADVNAALDDLGAHSNACTSEEETVFYFKTLPELQEDAVKLLGDLARPALRKDDFESEKQVVLEEIKMYDDMPPFGIDEKLREYFWIGHPLARSVSGTLESVSALTPEAMRDYWERRYVPNNIVFAATGRVDFNLLTRWVDAAFGGLRSGDAPRAERRAAGRRGTTLLTRASATQEYVLQATSAPSCRDDVDALLLGALILGGDVGSRLFWELVDSGRAEAASLDCSLYVDSGMMVAQLECSPEDARENLSTMRALFSEAITDGVTEEELVRVKNKTLARVALQGERPLSRLYSVGDDWVSTGKYRSTSDLMAKIRQTTLEEVNAALRKYPPLDPFTIAVGPLTELDVCGEVARSE